MTRGESLLDEHSIALQNAVQMHGERVYGAPAGIHAVLRRP